MVQITMLQKSVRFTEKAYQYKQYCAVTNEGRKFPQPPCMAAVETLAPLIYCAILFILQHLVHFPHQRFSTCLGLRICIL